MTIVIRNIPQETWRNFKAEAAREGKNLGEFFAEIFDEHMKKSDSRWDDILRRQKALTVKEANDVETYVKRMRERFKIGDR